MAFFSQVLQRREQLAKLTREEEEQEEQERAEVAAPEPPVFLPALGPASLATTVVLDC